MKTEVSETSAKVMAAAAPGVLPEPGIGHDGGPAIATSFADDRLVGVAAIAKFIDPSLSLWKAQRLLEDGYYPSWREGRIYVASKAALCERWRQMTGVANPHNSQPPPQHDRAA